MATLKPYTVTTRDSDGESIHKYLRLAMAKRKFLSMSGYQLPEGVNSAEAVSNYGCVVLFESSIDLTITEVVVAELDNGDNINEDAPNQYEGYHSYGQYGGAEHQMFGDAYLFQDCQGAW